MSKLSNLTPETLCHAVAAPKCNGQIAKLKKVNICKKKEGKFDQNCKKQDHQKWGYSTVTHMEQSVYLAKWKDLNKQERKEHRKRLNHRNGEDG